MSEMRDGNKEVVVQIIENLKRGMKFGAFDLGSNNSSYYFENGESVREKDLWEAVRVLHNLPLGHGKTLKQLCPDTFVGQYNYSFSKHKWKK